MEETLIEDLEEKLRQAMLASDIEALDELIADDLIFTMHTGLVINKQDDLEAHRTGIQKFAIMSDLTIVKSDIMAIVSL
jgi:ketosteroid isomerase-like protein